MNISKLSLNRNRRLLDILDDQFVFQINEFAVNFKADYSYVSDPPMFGDFG
jgi:hypothetical protein